MSEKIIDVGEVKIDRKYKIMIDIASFHAYAELATPEEIQKLGEGKLFNWETARNHLYDFYITAHNNMLRRAKEWKKSNEKQYLRALYQDQSLPNPPAPQAKPKPPPSDPPEASLEKTSDV